MKLAAAGGMASPRKLVGPVIPGLSGGSRRGPVADRERV